MTQTEINNIYAHVTAMIERGRLLHAFDAIINTAEGAMLPEVADSTKRAVENYRYILKYLTNDADDPQRPDMVARATLDAWHNLDLLVRHLRRPANGNLYFGTLRTLGKQRMSLGDRLRAYRNLLAQKASQQEIASAEHDIFNHIWVAFPMSAESADIVSALFADADIPHRVKVQAVGALGLGLTEAFDKRRLELLIDLYSDISTPEDIKLQALTMLLVALYKYRRRPLPPETARTIAVLADLPEWGQNLRTIFMAFIQARNTERVNRQMRDEILPGMMDVRDKLKDTLKDVTAEALNAEPGDANPEWQEILDKSGVGDKLRTLDEIQQRGGDVYMATFGGLKSFPFFTPVAAWFTPYSQDNPSLADGDAPREVLEVIGSMPFLCDTDKFSMALAMKMLPREQFEMLTRNLEASRNVFAEQAASILDGTPEMSARIAVTNTVRNLYRFVNLYRRKSEFYNPFAEGLNLLEVPVLADAFNDSELLRVIAEFFFSLEYWADAAAAFTRLDALDGPDGAVLEKLAYAHHRQRNYQKAIDIYHQAETFSPAKPWIQRRLAEAYSAVGRHADAEHYLEKLADTFPDDATIALHLADERLRNGDKAGALSMYFKSNFLDDNSLKSARPLAWALLLNARPADAEKTISQIAEERRVANDWLNYGHAALMQGRFGDALSRYRRVPRPENTDADWLADAIRGDIAQLPETVAETDLALLLDALSC